MSVAGLIGTRGSVGTVRRATEARSPSGGTLRSWTAVATDVLALLNEVSREQAQRMWGQELAATHLAVFGATADVQEHDGYVVTSGPYTGQRFRVQRIGLPGTGPLHLHAALVRAQDTEFV